MTAYYNFTSNVHFLFNVDNQNQKVTLFNQYSDQHDDAHSNVFIITCNVNFLHNISGPIERQPCEQRTPRDFNYLLKPVNTLLFVASKYVWYRVIKIHKARWRLISRCLRYETVHDLGIVYVKS